MSAINYSRRASLGILAASPAAMLPTLALLSCGQRVEAAGCDAIRAAIVHHTRCVEQEAAFNRDTFNPAEHAYYREIEAIPHVKTATGFLNIEGTKTHLSTSDEATVATARRVLNNPPSSVAEDDNYLRTIQEVVAAADHRAAAAQAIRDRHHMDALEEQQQAIIDRTDEALQQVADIPADSLDALLLKAEFMRDQAIWPEYASAIVADIATLAGRA